MPEFLSERWLELLREQCEREPCDPCLHVELHLLVIGGAAEEGVRLVVRGGHLVDCGRGAVGDCTCVLSAHREDWRALSEGRVRPRRALVERRVRVVGSLVAALRHSGALGRLLSAVSRVPTDW